MQERIPAHFHNDDHSRKCMLNVLRLHRDWTDVELVELARLKNHRSDKYLFECSRSDEGDPWCVISAKTHEILLHIAKIDCSYVVDSPSEKRLLRTKSIADVIGFGLSALERRYGKFAESCQEVFQLRHPAV